MDKPKWTDVAIVILTVGIVALAYMQWREMDSSGAQTDKIISADDRLAAANERFATAMENTVTQNQGALNETLGEMKKQSMAMQESANASVSQATGITESNRISRESLESVQRAFVIFDEMRATSAPGRWTFYPLIRNVGATTARASIHYFDAEKLSHEPGEREFTGPYKGRNCARVPIQPKAAPQLGFQRELNEQLLFRNEFLPGRGWIKRFDVSDGHVYVWGWSAYRDVFPRTPIHLTEFCQVYVDSRTVRSDDGQPSVELISADCNNSHNCTDEDCTDYGEIMRVLGEPLPPKPTKPN